MKDTSAAGNQGLKIIYPGAKMHTLQTTGKNGMAAVFFTFNDFIQMEFIPYGPIIDNRWFYYMGVVDAQCNPVMKRFLLFDEQKKSACNYSGQTQAVFSTHDGFISVYLVGNDFVYTEFDVNGKVLNKRVKFFRSENETIETNRVLSIAFYRETIYLFILQPPANIYRDQWHIDLLKRNIRDKKTKVTNNIFSNQDGWYWAKNLETCFSGDTVYM
ncbi:MAG: hypothetical protein L0Y76_02885, partial [Ignavibacteria bacterium]|nr:hypothetical protein [Ignavibacteria bacterium]